MPNIRGWIKDKPSDKDYTLRHPKVYQNAVKLGMFKTSLPVQVDLRSGCITVMDQGNIGSCTANSAAALYGYMCKKAFGDYHQASRLFIYKATRLMSGLSGDTGAELRSTMGAMAYFGCPPEKFWAYSDDTVQFDRMPACWVWSLAQNFQASTYVKLDGANGTETLQNMKASLAAGFPYIFGFNVYGSYGQASNNGLIPYPARGENCIGGHAIMACGYNDSIVIHNNMDGSETTGALIFQNSWGQWGQQGFGYLPYKYVLDGLCGDAWNLQSAEFVDSGKFIEE